MATKYAHTNFDMRKEEIIEKTKEFVKKTLSKDSSGHDWWHTYRVYKMSTYNYKKRKG